MIQANLIDSYCTKLHKAIKTSSSIENISGHFLSNLFTSTNNCFCQFKRFEISGNLQLIVIKDVHY